MTAIGFVGLGAMGSRIAGRLLEGNTLYGTNRTASRASELIRRGMHWRGTPREVAEAAAVIFSMVTDDAALEAITSGPDGILAGLAPGTIYVDMSTVSYVGRSGQALLLKLAINISLATQMLAFSEGVLLAERGGIDPALAAAVMTGSAIGSPMLQARAPLMLNLPEQAWFDVQLMHKDIRLAVEAARQLSVAVPSAAVADGMLAKAEELGYARRDIAAFFEVLTRMAGTPGAPGAAARPTGSGMLTAGTAGSTP